MDAMNYEYLIRKAFHCGRYGVAGANADIYRGFEREWALYQENLDAVKNGKPRTWSKDIEDMAYDLGVRTGRVTAYMDVAISHVLKNYSDRLTEEQQESLEDLSSILMKPTKEKIEEVLEKGHEIFSAAGLSIG